ncbi:MAG: cap guanine-N2 methyltransferase [Gemmataceae bacterium]|nr:cap guanine-N2 methyltransferase [Gemmataceae bacterium]
MDLETFRQLLSPAGQTAIADAAVLGPTEAGFLAAFEKLRKRHPPVLAKAALETVLLRGRARGKHSFWERSYYTREALEQASGEAVSRYRAGRFRSFPTVLDLCSGIGTDAVRLALAGSSVEAVESDPLRLAMAEANTAAADLSGRVRFHPGDVLTIPLPPADAAFVDPSRREGERRFLDPDRYTPPLGAVLARVPSGFPLAAKIAPGVARSDIERYDAEAEFISAGGELKECVLWFGPLKAAKRRATVLSSSSSRPEEVLPSAPAALPQGERRAATHTLTADVLPPDPPPAEVRGFVYDPDPAVIRAELLPLVAEQLGAVPVDHGVALLTGAEGISSDFADRYRVEHAAPFHLAKLRDYLRERRVGRVTILKRAIDLDVNEVTRKLKLDGPESRALILTRSLGRPVAVVGWKEDP